MKEQETLLVMAKNREEFDKWVRKWGIGLKNISIIHADEPMSDWEGKIFYTTLDNGDKSKGHKSILESLKKYQFVSHKSIEKKVKNIKVQQQATQ